MQDGLRGRKELFRKEEEGRFHQAREKWKWGRWRTGRRCFGLGMGGPDNPLQVEGS